MAHPKSPDKICEQYAGRGVSLKISLLGDLVLVEGDAVSLDFLGRVLIAQAGTTDDGFQLSPKGPGRKHFSRRSSLGIYIHRVPSRPLKS